MNDKSNLDNYIIVLGTTKSGSSAVYDYLAGRGDIYDPLQGTEYQLPQMPNGLMTLEAISKNAFHPPTSDYVLNQFYKLTKKLSRSETLWQYGKGFSSKLPSFDREIQQFIDEICIAKLPMRLHWHRSMSSSSYLKFFINKLKIYLNFNDAVPDTRLITSQDEYIIAAQKLHSRLFAKNQNKQPILLNQGGSGWNPIESTKFFLNRKVVVVLRDPRDVFAELKQIKNATFVEGFINWYKEMQRRINQVNNPIILSIKFEDFVFKNKEVIEILCEHFSLNSNISSTYNPNLSKKNIGKFKSILSKREINIIENNLSDYMY